MDALTNVHVKLLAFDFLSLTPISADSFSRKGTPAPLSRAETVGIVTSRHLKPGKFLKFAVDDGTGCIPCILWLNQLNSPYFSRRNPSDVRLIAQTALNFASLVQLGASVRVRGRITNYNATLQLTVSEVVIERDPNAEILHWLQCIRLAQARLRVSTFKRSPETLEFQLAWIRELPLLLIQLDDKNPASSRAVLHLQLSLGQRALMNSSFSQEYDNMQFSLTEFYSKNLNGEVHSGPFMKIPRDVQKLSLSCLYYFSFLDPVLLQSLVSCCLCHDLEPFLLFKLLGILDSAFRSGHIQTTDYFSFLITLLLHYRVSSETNSATLEKDSESTIETYKLLTNGVSSCLSRIGDACIVFQILEKVVIDQSGKLPLENICGLLRMLMTLDSKPAKLSEQSIMKLGDVLPEYMIGVVSCITDEVSKSTTITQTIRSRYYILPCLLLFYRSNKLLNLFLSSMGSLVSENYSRLCDHYVTDHSSRINAIVSAILLIHADAKMQRILLLCKAEIDLILQNIQGLQSFKESSLTIEERHNIQCAYERLKDITL